MSTIAELNVRFAANTKSLTAGLREAKKRTRDFSRDAQRQVGRAVKSFRSFSSSIVNTRNVIATLAGAGGIGLLVRTQMEAIQSTQRLAQRLNGTAKEISGLEYAAKASGAPVDRLREGLSELVQRIGEADQLGTGSAAESLEMLGLSARNLSQQRPAVVIGQVADALNRLPNAAARASIADELMGGDSRELLNMLRKGSAGINELRREAEQLGYAVDDVDAARVLAADQAISRAGAALQGAGRVITSELAPYIEAVSNRLVDAAKNGKGFGETVISAISTAGNVVGVMADGLHGIRVIFQGLKLIATGFAATAASAFEGLVGIIVKTRDFGAAAINDLIRAFNSIPGMDDIPLIQSMENRGWVKAIRTMGEATREQVGIEREKLHEAMMKPLPSSAIDGFMKGVKEEAAKFELPDVAAAGGGGGGLDLANAGREQDYQQRLERLREHLRTEEESERASHLSRMEDLNELREQGFIQDQVHAEMREQLEASHQDRLNEIRRQGQSQQFQDSLAFLDSMEKAQKQSGAAQLNTVTGALSKMTAAGAQHNRKMFEANKMAATANAIVSTYQGASKALEWGWPLGPVFAGIITAAGMARVSAIQSQSFGGGKSGGGGGGTSPSVAGSTPAPPVTPVSDQQGGGSQRRVYVEFEGDDDTRVSLRQFRQQIRRLREEDPEAELVF